MRLEVAPFAGSSVEAVAAPVRDEDAENVDVAASAAAGRASVNIGTFDLAASGGWIYDRYVAGFDAQGPLGGALLRAAVTRVSFRPDDFADDPDPYVRAMADLDYGFAWPWNPYVLVEYHYNGLGEDDPEKYAELAARESFTAAASRGEAVNLGRHYGAAMISVMPHPLVTASATSIVNLLDRGAYAAFVLTGSVVESLELQLGANLTFGPIPSEYGGFEDPFTGKEYETADLYYAYLKWYW
ncbi:MAG: hypothetical protein M5R36_27815 [Deltaproteobacteria bacterium]|nr:hypothetical protein [Deltaproteobacteria bacterium]